MIYGKVKPISIMLTDKSENIASLDLQAKIFDIGYIVVSRSNHSILDKLWQFYQSEEEPYVTDGFYSTMMHTDFEHKKAVNTFLCSQLYEFASLFLHNYKPLFANYLVKSPKTNRQVGLHQDWTYTDELKYHSINVWMPLQATNAQNGALYVVPGSHKLPYSLRYTPFDENLYDVDIKLLKRKAVLIETKPGDAVIYDSRLLHFSEGNLSNDYRVACAGIFLPEAAPAMHYFRKGNEIHEYSTNMDFYCKLMPGVQPQQNPIRIFQNSEVPSNDSVNDFLKNAQDVVEEKA
jgi:hypothetical protein